MEKKVLLSEDETVKTISTFLRGFASTGTHVQTLTALGYARSKHAGQMRRETHIFYIH